MELTDIQTSALAQALSKVVEPYCNPRKDGLRAKVDRELLDDYRKNGTDRKRISINGTEVGTISIAFTKAKSEQELFLDDIGRFEGWIMTTDEGLDTLHALLMSEGATKLLDIAKAYGFLPDGCHVKTVETAEQPKGTRLSVNPEKVAQALKGELPEAVGSFLQLTEGSNER